MILIVGGGLAGVSAALEAKLNAPEKEVVLLEARNRLGGATWSFEKDGVSYDNGQHVFLRCCTAYLEFLERVGSADSVYLQPRLKVPVVDMKSGKPKTAQISRRGKMIVGSLILYKHLSKMERMRVVRTALALRKLDPQDSALDEISFGDWLAGRGESQNALAALWNLIVLPTINVSVENASLKLAAKVFITGLLEDARGGDIGWGLKPFSDFHHQASHRTLNNLGVKVEYNTKVQNIELAGAGNPHKVYAGESVHLADSIIVALAHNQLADILPDGVLESGVNPQALGVSPIINMHFVFNQKVMNHQVVAGLNTDLQYVFDRTLAAGLDPSSAQCLAISLSGADKYLSQTAKDLESYFYQELLKMFPAGKQAKLLHSMVTRENTATFRGTPGSHKHRAKTKTQIPGVYMAGAWTDTQWPATMEGAVRSGKAAAQMALEN